MVEQAGVALAREWTDAWNAVDGDRLAAMCHPEFRFHHPKGDVVDVGGLREVLARQSYGAAMKLVPLAVYGRDDRLAVAARIEYRQVSDGGLMGVEDGAVALTLRDGLIVRAAPQSTLADALEVAGLSESDRLVEWADPPADPLVPS